MTFDADPPRFGTLSGKLPPELLRDIGALRDVEVPPAELERVGMRLRSQLAADAEQARRAVRPRKRLFAGTLGLALTFAIGAAAGGVVSVGLYLQHRQIDPNEPAPPATEAPRERRPSSPSASAVPAPADSSEASVPVASAASPVHSAGRAASSAAHFERVADGAAGAPGPAEEVALLARARAALEADPGKALALTSNHARTFARGVLAQEREVIAIDALLRLGRRPEARARADRFHRLYPESTHGRRVDVLFEIR